MAPPVFTDWKERAVVKVRKETAGADSYGNTWEPGDVYDLPDTQAGNLLRLPGFTRVSDDTPAKTPEPREEDKPRDENTEGESDESGEGETAGADKGEHEETSEGELERPRRGRPPKTSTA